LMITQNYEVKDVIIVQRDLMISLHHATFIVLTHQRELCLKMLHADNQTPVFKFVYQKKNTKIGDPMWSMYSRK
jgi:hypothetical protein